MEDITKLKDFCKDVVGYELLYKVDRNGMIFNIKTQKYCKLSNSLGYKTVGLYKNGIRKTFRVHRLVAEAFIPNPLNKPEINHINGIKSDNRIENLEWNTRSENEQYAWDNGFNTITKPWLNKKGKEHPHSKELLQYDKNGKFIKSWDNVIFASKALNIKASSIYNHIYKKHKCMDNGYIFRYKEDNEDLSNNKVEALKEVAREAKNEQLEVIKEYKALIDFKKRLVEEINKKIPDDWEYHNGKTIKNVVNIIINDL